MNLLEKFKSVTTFVFDVDGVLTDGTLTILPGGVMARKMNAKDGYALQLAVKKGYHVVIISGGVSEEVADRLHKLGVSQVFMKTIDKAGTLNAYLQENKLSWREVLFMGDDIPDLVVMKKVGIACCPADAVQEIKEVSGYISYLNGGFGCGRDVIEKVLKLRSDWNNDTHIRST
ncbi:MAG: HAD hydrolase family protein [Bacteroidota bacterium]|nr:HAD hydrolase family protein [Bacteroidota bacterium]